VDGDKPTQSVPPSHSIQTFEHLPEPDPNATTIHDGPTGRFSLSGSINRYEIQKKIAQGGMGEVFTAWDRSLDRVVAIKILRKDLCNRPDMVARFLEEARITGQFQHPGIPPIHDLGTLSDGMPFIAMKLIKGKTLAEILTKDKASHTNYLPVLEQVAQTVAYAHNKRVIHRDLKPGNIMVGDFGEVQVMDWGLAKFIHDTPKLNQVPTETPADQTTSPVELDRNLGSETQAGTMLGTLAYMPPEQAKGEINRIDARADVFCLRSHPLRTAHGLASLCWDH
jgi:eukaryotic-like serine/threonine-protein kinase